MRRHSVLQWFPVLRTRAHFGCLIALCIFNVGSVVRNTKTLNEIDTRQVHVPEPGAHSSQKNPRRVVSLQVTAPRRDLQQHKTGADQKSSVERVMEIQSQINDMYDDDTLPPRESWSYPAPGSEQEKCEPMKDWQTMSYPTCNDMHSLGLFDKVRFGQRNETNVVKVSPKPAKHVARRNWVIPSRTNNGDAHIVLKNLKIGTSFDETSYERQRLDALAMETLSWSSHVTDIYGHCGFASITEFADGGTLEDLLKKSEITPRERLVHAVDLAQGVADLHIVDRDGVPSMVHRDLDVDNIELREGSSS